MSDFTRSTDPDAVDEFDSTLDQMADIADEIASRFQAGDSVDVESIVERHPDLEGQIRSTHASLRQVFGIRATLENAKSVATDILPRDKMIGEYRIIRELGRGGMGIVYEAEQASLNRRVALKVLPFAALLDSKRLERFRNEARAAAQLKHPNIVSIHAVGCEQSVHFFSMELIEGNSLATIIANMGSPTAAQDFERADDYVGSTAESETQTAAQLSTQYSGDRRSYVRAVARIGVQAAEALHYAHQEGVIHRDIKPANLLLDRDGVLHVADFGLARLESGSDLTVTGDVVGTLRYMSPEQLETGALVDQRTDVYSLGITLYELATGHAAFPARRKQYLIRQILEDDLPPITRANPAIPKDLANVIHKATAKNRNDRYDTAQGLADDLARFLEHKPVTARQTSQVGRLKRWAQRSPVVATLSGLLFATLLVAAIAGAAGTVHLSRVSTNQAAVAERTRLRLYASDIRRAADLLEEGDTMQAIKVLEQYNPQDTDYVGTTDYRNFEWYYLRTQCDELSPRWTFGHPVSCFDAAFSPDGKLLATCAWSRPVELWDIDTGQKVHSMKGHSKYCRRVLFANDGQNVISCSRDGTIRFWDVQSGIENESARISSQTGHARDLALSPDGRWMAALWFENGYKNAKSPIPATIRVWELDSRELVTELTGLDSEETGICYSPDGSHLIAGGEQGKLLSWSCPTWELEQEIVAHQNHISAVSWSPNGKNVVTASHVQHKGFIRGEFKVWDATTWKPVTYVQHHDERIHEVDFTPDSQSVLIASIDSNVSIWGATDGKCIRSFRAHAARVSSARMSPDGSLLATASVDNLAKVWKVSDLVEESDTRFVSRDNDGFIHSLVIAPNGKSVFTADVTGRVVERDLATGKVEYAWDTEEPTGWRIEVAVSPDSRRIAVAKGWSQEGIEDRGEIAIYDVITHEKTIQFPTPNPYMHGLEFSPDGKLLAFGSQKELNIFDSHTGEIVESFDDFAYIKMIRWSPDQKQLVVSESVGTTSVFTVPEFKLRKKFTSDDGWGTIGLAYSPDGQVFATGGGSRVVKIWDAESLELLQSFDECPDWIAHVHFSADGKRVLSTGKDGFLRVWHRDLGVCLLSLYVSHEWPMNGRFSPDGRTIAAGADVLRIWRATDKFKPIPVYLPPNQPCPMAMELQNSELAAGKIGSTGIE